MTNKTISILCLLGLAVVCATSSAQEKPTTRAEIRINLPEGAAPVVSVKNGDRRIVVALPRGSEFPLDFAAASGGLLRGGRVRPVGDGRVELELELARGLLDRIDYGPDAVVLHLAGRNSRFESDAADQYRLGPEDRITLTVHNQPNLNTTLTITDAGTITAPMVGELGVAGMTPREVALRLTDMLGRDYLVDPQVDVEVNEYRSQWVYVTGEVRLPSRVPLRGGTTLKEVLAEAGSFTENGGEEILISRGSETLPVDRASFERGEVDPVLRHEDIIEVKSARYCYIQGEVRSPGKIRAERGLTLLRAISSVGGLTEWADKKLIKVLYDRPAGQHVATYNLKRIMAGKDEDPRLSGGEKIIVQRRYF